MAESQRKAKPKGISHKVFENLGSRVEQVGDEEEERVVEQIESLCMNCEKNGTTRILLTQIPYFREIILMSFYCPHCHFKNSEIQSAGQIQGKGSRYTFQVTKAEDLSRQVVKSDTCETQLKELELNIPSGRGQLTTIEGLLSMVLEDLEFHQPIRRTKDLEAYEKIEKVVQKGREILEGKQLPFTVEVDDPAGNAWIEPSLDNSDKKWTRTEYIRTAEQNEALSITEAGEKSNGDAQSEVLDEEKQAQILKNLQESGGDPENADIVPDEVYSFLTNCPACSKPCRTNMKLVNIPHFKEVILMATTCDHCRYRTSEVKTGGAVPEKARRITLRVEDIEDLGRDILKSETCAFSSPELDLSINPGTLGGRFTTVEGLLTQVKEQLQGQVFGTGDESDDEAANPSADSMVAETKTKWSSFFHKIDEAVEGRIKFTVVLEDPLAASYVQNLLAPDPDPQITSEEYERTELEEEELGLGDMKTENYGETS